MLLGDRRERLSRRVSDTSPSLQRDSVSSTATLSIRMWPPALDDLSDGSPLKKITPAACVADLIEASGGNTVSTDGDLLVSNFSCLQTALLTARRIQWAVFGLSEAGTTGNGNSAILIHSVNNEPSQARSDSANYFLDHASPGQILLSETAGELLENLPGLSLLPVAGGMRELRWHASEVASSRLKDDEVLGQLIRQHGLEDPGLIASEEIVPPPPISGPAFANTPANVPTRKSPKYVAVGEPAGILRGIGLSRLSAMPLWLKWTSGAVLLAIGIALFFAFLHTKSPVRTSNQTISAASNVQPPSQSAGNADATGVQPPVVKVDEARKQSQTSKTTAPSKGSDSRRNQHTAPAASEPTAACTLLNTNEINSVLGIADASFQNRKYKESERRYKSVLACQPNNPRALSGLERARTSLQLQQSSGEP
jgi:hypothetical protein